MATIKYQLDSLFRDNHGVIFMITKIPEYTIRRDKKVVITNPNYHLLRVPDIVIFQSKYDNLEVVNKYPILKIEEELIDKNLSKAVWEII